MSRCEPGELTLTGVATTRVISCSAVLFDCDGVLVDSAASVALTWGRWARGLGLDVAMVQGMVHGRRSADTVALLVPEERRDEELARIDRYEIEDAGSVRAVEGASALLRSLPASRWAVVTSGRVELALARLAAAGLPRPAVLIGAEDVVQGKPDPEGYKKAAEALGAQAAEAVVFEDAPVGIQAARAAGVGTVVGVGDPAVVGSADLVVEDLRPLRWEGDHLEVSVPA